MGNDFVLPWEPLDLERVIKDLLGEPHYPAVVNLGQQLLEYAHQGPVVSDHLKHLYPFQKLVAFLDPVNHLGELQFQHGIVLLGG